MDRSVNVLSLDGSVIVVPVNGSVNLSQWTGQ